MNGMRALYQLIRADFLERTRRYSFLITLGVMLYVGYVSVPPLDSGRLTVNLGNMRGVYNSAWIGSMIALLSSLLLSLPGFYLVKNAVERDRETGVGQILATTPVSKIRYMLGKFLSNFIFLTVIVAVVGVAAAGMQLIRGEVMRLDVWALVAPFLFTTLPTMALVAAIALFFETIPFLRKGVGNIAYFVLYLTAIIVSLSGATFDDQGVIEQPNNDLFGVTAVGASMLQEAQSHFPEKEFELSIGMTQVEDTIRTFRWEGVDWTGALFLDRLLWVGVALGITLLAAALFNRFDPAGEGLLQRSARRAVPEPDPADEAVAAQAGPPARVASTLSPLDDEQRRFRYGRVLQAELRLMLKGQRWWWYLVALGLIVAGAVVPDAWPVLLPVAWLWPVLIWSRAGTRERQFHTRPVVFSAAYPLRRQLPTTWLAGVLLALVTGSGVAARLVLTGAWPHLLAWGVAALFIPTLALTLGIWSGTSKLFEATYVVLWYLGPINHAPGLDFMATGQEALANGLPAVYLGLTALLFVLAVLGRRRQIRR